MIIKSGQEPRLCQRGRQPVAEHTTVRQTGQGILVGQRLSPALDGAPARHVLEAQGPFSGRELPSLQGQDLPIAQNQLHRLWAARCGSQSREVAGRRIDRLLTGEIAVEQQVRELTALGRVSRIRLPRRAEPVVRQQNAAVDIDHGKRLGQAAEEGRGPGSVHARRMDQELRRNG
jgi:hypothetical protein